MPSQRLRSRVAVARARERFLRVDLKGAGLTLGGRPILRRIDWSVRPGQRWVLIGPNGAGKTLLLKSLAGDVWPTAGQGSRCYYWRGERFEDPYGVKEQIAYLGAERQDRYEHYRWNYSVQAVVGTGLYRTEIPLDTLSQANRRRVVALLARLRLRSLARRRFLTLSYGERRLVLLARALAAAPKLLLLDEPFNGLDASNRARALHCLRLVGRSGLPWVLSTHRDADIPGFATHRCELRAGRLYRRRLRTQRTQMTRARRSQAAARAAHGGVRAAASPLVRLRDVTVWRAGIAALRDVSLELRTGECWVVHGANGSGKSSLIQAVYGDLPAAHGGAIERAGIARGMPVAQFKRRVGLVAPELQALHPLYLHVAEVVASGLDATIAAGAAAAPRSARVRRALRRAGAAHLIRRRLRTLSYGQLRRVLFARALVREPDILLLDEPYEGLDAPMRTRLRALVERTLRSGMTVVMATHHADEWPPGATHELQLAHGRVVYRGPLRSRRTGVPPARGAGHE